MVTTWWFPNLAPHQAHVEEVFHKLPFLGTPLRIGFAGLPAGAHTSHLALLQVIWIKRQVWEQLLQAAQQRQVDYAHPHQQNSRYTSFFVLKCPRGLINSPHWREPRWPKIPNLTPARLQHNSGHSCHLPGRTKTARSECEKCLELGGHESKKGVCPAVHLY